MNLYPQDAYYFGAYEIYSFHMGLMARMSASNEYYNPESYVEAASLGGDMSPLLLRKLKSVSTLIDIAIEIEDFQAIGIQCREIMIELRNYIYQPFMASEKEQPKESDFKKKAELFIQFYLQGSENNDYRKVYRRMTENTWDFTKKITHSRNATFYDVSSCATMCIPLISVYENMMQKVYDSISLYTCRTCKSKKLNTIGDEQNDEDVAKKFYMECEGITEIIFEAVEYSKSYVRGKSKDNN